MTTSIIGVGNLGSTVARHLVNGGETVVLAAQDEAHARALAEELGPNASATSVDDAIAAGDAVVLAVWLAQSQDLLPELSQSFEGKVVIDPSNPLGFDESGQMIRTLPDGQSAGSIVASLLPQNAHFVKAFGTLGADALAGNANREPRAVLFYAADDDEAADTAERLIRSAGFDPFKVGGLDAAVRIEMPGGDLHQAGLNGDILDLEAARTVVEAAGARA